MGELTEQEVQELLENPVNIVNGSTPATENLRLVDLHNDGKDEFVVDLEDGTVRGIGYY